MRQIAEPCLWVVLNRCVLHAQGFADHLLKQHSQGGSLLPPGPGGSLLPPVNGGFPQAPSLGPGPRPPGPPSMAAVGEAMRR